MTDLTVSMYRDVWTPEDREQGDNYPKPLSGYVFENEAYSFRDVAELIRSKNLVPQGNHFESNEVCPITHNVIITTLVLTSAASPAVNRRWSKLLELAN